MKPQILLMSLACLGLCTAITTSLRGQPPDTDPTQFMRAAAESNSMIGPGMKPWHLRAKYQQFKPDGSLLHEGSIEIWWASDTEFKTSYTGAEYSRTEYRSGTQTFFTGHEDLPASLENLVDNILLHPLPEAGRIARSPFMEKDLTLSGTAFQCYYQAADVFPWVLRDSTGKTTTLSPSSQVFCFKGLLPIVRLIASIHLSDGTVDSQTVFNQIVRMNERYVSKNIRMISHGSPWANVDVEQIEPALGVDQAELKAPPDAKIAPPRRVNVASGIMGGLMLHQQKPVYPSGALIAHVQGTVVLEATISKQGTITNLKVIGGPPLLQQAAIEAVQQWTYKPYLLNGEPVEVETLVNVVFSMGPY